MTPEGGGGLEALTRRLQLLEDRDAIRALITAIARATDRYDDALLRASVFADASLDMGGVLPVRGADFASAIKPPAAPRPGRMHFVSNERIDVDGDRAAAETYILSCQDLLVGGVRTTRIRAGRYLDRFERREGRWGLSARMLVDEWSRVDAVTEAVTPGAHIGGPVPDDPSCPWHASPLKAG